MKPHANQSTEGMCNGKQAFLSWTQANAALKRRAIARKLSGRDLEPMKIYRCERCRKWHVASS